MTGVYRHTVADNRRKAAARAKECSRLINLMRNADTPYAAEIKALHALYEQVFHIWDNAPDKVEPDESKATEQPSEPAPETQPVGIDAD